MKDEVTTKYKLDISDFKKNITEANKAMKFSNAEFKAASAGMDDWRQSSEGLEAKLKQLNSALGAQKNKLESYQGQLRAVEAAQRENARRAEEAKEKYQQAAKQYGENSEEAKKYKTALNQIVKEEISNGKAADKLRISVLNQQAAYKNTEKEIRGYTQELKDLKDGSNQAEQATEKMKEGFTIVKGAIASFIADGIRVAIEGMKELALESEDTMSKFQASTGISADAMKKFKDEILDLYKNDYGESVEDVAESMAKVKQVTGETDPSKIKEMTKYAINLRDTFGSDFDESIRGINNLMYQYGINAEQAFNLFAKGSQEGLDYTNELGDNVAEYSGNFKQAGYTAGEYFQLLKNGTSNGAYNLDKVNDAINEATNKLADGSIEKNLKIFSSGTQKVFKEWQNGGATQKDVIDSVVKDINNCKNEQDALTMAATLFGTMGEDSNLDFIKSLTSVGDTFKNVQGTMESVDQTRWDNTKAQLTVIGRSLKVDVLQPIVSAVVPALMTLGKWFTSNTPVIVGSLIAIGTGFTVFNVATNITRLSEAFVMLKTTIKGLGLVMAATPVGWITAIAGATAGIVAYKLATDKTTSAVDKMRESHGKLNSELQKTDKEKKNNIKTAEEEGIKTQNLFERLKDLMGVEKKSAAHKQRIKQIVEELNGIMPDLNLHYQEEKDKLNQSYDSIQKNIDATKELMLVKATEKNMAATMENISKIEAEQAVLVEKNIQKEKEYKDAQEAALKAAEKAKGKGKYTEEGREAEKAAKKASLIGGEWHEVKEEIKENEKALKKYYKEYDNLDNYKIGEKAKADLGSLTEKYKKEGMKIPTAISDGIKSGETKPKKAAEQVANLMSFEKAVKKAGIDGKKIPEAVTIAVANGSVKAKTAVDKMQDGIKFEKMVKDAGVNGKKIPEKIMAEVLNGKKKPEKAAKEVIRNANKESEKEAKKSKAGKEKSSKESKDIKAGEGKVKKASKDATKAGNKASEKEAGKNKGGSIAGNKFAKDLGSKKGEAGKKAKSVAKEANSEMGKEDTYTTGINFVQGFINGMGSLLGGPIGMMAALVGGEALKALKDKLGEQSPSKETYQSGDFFDQGLANGIRDNRKGAIKTAGELGNGTVAALNKSLDEHSASKKTKKSGSYFAQGLKLGITKAGKAAIKAAGKLGASSIKALAKAMSGEEKTIVSVMKDQISNVVKIAKNYTAGKFTEAGEAAGEAFSTAIERSMQTAQKKVAYLFEQQNQKYDKQLTNLENKKKNDKSIKKLDSLEKKELAALKKSKKYKKASKKKRKNMVDDVEEKYKKKRKKLTKPYDDAIKDLKKKQKAFATASEETLSAFTEGMSEFASKAEQMVSDTINGITETYQAKWDELESLQESIITKLQSFGELFTVSSAGVMTINDIKQQTEDIKAYMGSLNNIKGKVSEELFEQIASYDVEQGKAFMDQLLSMSDEELKAYDNAYTEKMRLSEQLTKNMFQNDFAQIGKEYQSAIDKAFKDMKPKLEQLGKECMQGFISGLKGDTSFLSGEIKSITNSIINSFKGDLKIHSPSKVFENLGVFSIQGYVNGFVDKMAQLKKSMVKSIPIKEIGKITGKIPAASVEQVKGVKGSTEGKIINQTFNQYNNSPKPLNRFEVWRQTNNLLAYSKA